MAALLVNGFCGGGSCGGGSLKGLAGALAAWAAPGRSQEKLVPGRSGEALPERGTAPAAATLSMLPPLLRFSKVGSNCVTGRRLRRGAVDMVRAVRMLGAGSTNDGGGGESGCACMAYFSLSAFCCAICFFLRW